MEQLKDTPPPKKTSFCNRFQESFSCTNQLTRFWTLLRLFQTKLSGAAWYSFPRASNKKWGWLSMLLENLNHPKLNTRTHLAVKQFFSQVIAATTLTRLSNVFFPRILIIPIDLQFWIQASSVSMVINKVQGQSFKGADFNLISSWF